MTQNPATNFELGRQRLIDFVVEDDDSDVRETAYGGLEKLTEDSSFSQSTRCNLADVVLL